MNGRNRLGTNTNKTILNNIDKGNKLFAVLNSAQEY